MSGVPNPDKLGHIDALQSVVRDSVALVRVVVETDCLMHFPPGVDRTEFRRAINLLHQLETRLEDGDALIDAFTAASLAEARALTVEGAAA